MHVILGTFYILLHRLPDKENAPFQNDLTKEWKVFKANRYTADQSPLLMEEPSSFFTQYSETLPRTSLREQPHQVGLADGPPGVL